MRAGMRAMTALLSVPANSVILPPFASAIVLAMIALLIGYESLSRLFRPVPIAFAEAIPLAALGLGVNLISAWLLRDDHDHDTARRGRSDHDHHHADHNLRAAYLHVVADAAVSLMALFGLSAGRILGWIWMDPVMGMIGALVIANWSWSLVRNTSSVLLDMQAEAELAREIACRIEAHGGDRIADLHLWRIGPGHNAAIVSLVSDRPETPAVYKARLAGLTSLSHITVEIQCCPGAH
jgi:cation diffusion facilitator family transporter